jgi:SpoVK/Ycf46/Vps4 family AAA+-type ATPase
MTSDGEMSDDSGMLMPPPQPRKRQKTASSLDTMTSTVVTASQRKPLAIPPLPRGRDSSIATLTTPLSNTEYTHCDDGDESRYCASDSVGVNRVTTMRSVSPEECTSSSSSSANSATGWEEQQEDEAAVQPFRFDETHNSAFVSIATMDNDSSRYDNMMLSPPPSIEPIAFELQAEGCDDDDVVNDDRLTLGNENVHLLDANATAARGVDHLHNRVSECDESDDLGENHQDDGNDDGIIATSDTAMNKQQQQSHEFVSSPLPPPLVGVSFRDIIGHSQAKLRLDEALLPLALPQDIASSVLTGIRAAPASILLHGPPGCGKTKLAKAMAGEAQAVFLSIGPSDILSKFVGESEASVRGLFQKARREAMKIESKCAVIFFDEIDALGRSRTDDDSGKVSHAGGDNSARRVLAELLIQMTALNDNDIGTGSEVDVEEEEYDGYCDDDGYSFSGRSMTESKPRIIVVAATNRPEDCDPALLRRFAVRVLIGLPSRKDRKKIIKRLLVDVDHTITSIQLDELALTTEGWSGSDLESMTREAVMAPVRECLRAIAVLKRKESRVASLQSHQRSGDDSSQKKQSTTTHSTSTPREALLNSFRNLRPVSNIDFEDGIAFFLGEAAFGINSSKNTHYDSSSSSEDEA